MIIDDASHFPSQPRGEVVLRGRLDPELVRVEPLFAFRIALHSVNVHRLVPLIGIEVKPPTQEYENGRHNP
jgi:hypothetical protein